MAKLQWDQAGEKFYETGVEQCALYFPEKNDTTGKIEYKNGVAWNGLTKISEKPTGAETTSLYANDAKYINLVSGEDFEASVEAYTYPEEFEECDGSKTLTYHPTTGSDVVAKGVSVGQQARKSFGLAYKTKIGNDVDGNDHGWKYHLIYGATCSPSEKDYQTINDSPEAITFSWEMKTTPVNVEGMKPTACLTIDTTQLEDAAAAKLPNLEKTLYGGTESGEDPTLPMPDEVAAILYGSNNSNENKSAESKPVMEKPIRNKHNN